MATFDDQWLSRALLEAGVGVWSLDVTQGVVRPHGDWWPAPNGPARTRALTLADCGQYVHDSERGSVFSAISALVEGSVTQARLEFRLRLQSAEWRWYDCRAHAPTRDANGRATLVVGTLVDCHEAVVSRELNESLERRLRETQARFHSFVANTRDAVWCYEFDPPISLALPVHEQFERVLEGRLVECNQAYVDMRGASSVEDFIGQRVRSIHRSSLDSLRQLYLRMVEHHFVLEDSRLEQDPASGGPRYVTVRAQGIRAGPTLTRIWGSFADVTAKLQADRDREALEAQLRQSQKMESIGTLTGGMAHDFNNVLAAISAEADLGLYAVGSGDLNELRESLTLIKKSADRGATLTRRLLTFARRHTTPRRVTRLDLLLHELWPMLRRLISESISLKLETPEALWALVDPSQLEQVVVNLVVNARDAIGERGGEIVVSCVPATVGPEATRAKTWVTAGRFVRLSVADNGAGISPTLHDRVFEPFFTTKRLGEGTGLGLSMVYSILKQHDGFVELESNEGQGARFDAFLPRAEPPTVPLALAKTPLPFAPAHERVLLVEDEPELRESAKRILQSGGYQVVTAPDGVAARAALAEFGPFGLLVLDVVMPKCSGPELYESLAEPRPPVLFTTGYADGALDGPLYSGPGRGMLPKPYGREGLLWAVRGVLDSRE